MNRYCIIYQLDNGDPGNQYVWAASMSEAVSKLERDYSHATMISCTLIARKS